MEPDVVPVFCGLREYERRRHFWEEYAKFALDARQAERFCLYGKLGLPIAEEAREQLERMRPKQNAG